jgi:hypothetical protein
VKTNWIRILPVLILVSCKSTLQTKSMSDISGEYISDDSKFEKTSILTLTNDSTFIYFYMLGGCRDKINGKWSINNGSIILQTSADQDTTFHHVPNLNKISWTITKAGIKPDDVIDNGCFKENSVHIKQRRIKVP